MNEIKLESEEQILKLFRKKMKKEGWTQRWIASMFGYDTSTVNAWFCKRARLKVDSCIQICKALGWEIIVRPKNVQHTEGNYIQKEDQKNGK